MKIILLFKAVEGGVEANHKILDIMAACIHTPRFVIYCQQKWIGNPRSLD